MSVPPLRSSDQIPGDILAGFSRENAYLIFLKFNDRTEGRRWLLELVPNLTFTADVVQHNQAANPPNDVWRSLSLTSSGVSFLSLNLGVVLEEFSQAFREGPAKRATFLGDVEASDPYTWKFGGPENDEVHALLTLTADDPIPGAADALNLEIQIQRNKLIHGPFTIVFEESAKRLPALAGPGSREHFGFRDGIGQPGVQDFDEPDPTNARYVLGRPNRQLIGAGEFILGQPVEQLQVGHSSRRVRNIPDPLKDGSFQVVRRLRQDVAAWNEQVRTQALALGISEDLFGGKLMGRYHDGNALYFNPAAPPTPGTDPLTAAAIDFTTDPKGFDTPLFAHIRSMYPGADHFDINKRRIIRRGIPYGPAFDVSGHEADDRGLYFIAYMSNIREQFEFLQGRFANSVDIPKGRGGIDPVVGEGSPAHELPVSSGVSSASGGSNAFDFTRCVRTTGAIYAFAAPRATLEKIAGGAFD